MTKGFPSDCQIPCTVSCWCIIVMMFVNLYICCSQLYSLQIQNGSPKPNKGGKHLCVSNYGNAFCTMYPMMSVPTYMTIVTVKCTHLYAWVHNHDSFLCQVNERYYCLKSMYLSRDVQELQISSIFKIRTMNVMRFLSNNRFSWIIYPQDNQYVCMNLEMSNYYTVYTCYNCMNDAGNNICDSYHTILSLQMNSSALDTGGEGKLIWDFAMTGCEHLVDLMYTDHMLSVIYVRYEVSHVCVNLVYPASCYAHLFFFADLRVYVKCICLISSYVLLHDIILYYAQCNEFMCNISKYIGNSQYLCDMRYHNYELMSSFDHYGNICGNLLMNNVLNNCERLNYIIERSQRVNIMIYDVLYLITVVTYIILGVMKFKSGFFPSVEDKTIMELRDSNFLTLVGCYDYRRVKKYVLIITVFVFFQCTFDVWVFLPRINPEWRKCIFSCLRCLEPVAARLRAHLVILTCRHSMRRRTACSQQLSQVTRTTIDGSKDVSDDDAVYGRDINDRDMYYSFVYMLSEEVNSTLLGHMCVNFTIYCTECGNFKKLRVFTILSMRGILHSWSINPLIALHSIEELRELKTNSG